MTRKSNSNIADHNGIRCGTLGTAGTANTGGGGGGGATGTPVPNTQGGSGIVIIRYKFQ